jgi:hypothetical protein
MWLEVSFGDSKKYQRKYKIAWSSSAWEPRDAHQWIITQKI